MPRETTRTERRLTEDLEVLGEYTDIRGVCEGRGPAAILKDYYGYPQESPAYTDVRMLAERGWLEPWPPGAKGYHRGFRIKPRDLEGRLHWVTGLMLEHNQELIDLQNSYQQLHAKIAEDVTEMESIIKELSGFIIEQARVD